MLYKNRVILEENRNLTKVVYWPKQSRDQNTLF